MPRLSKTTADKGQTPRRRLCLAGQTHDKTAYLCLRDLDHPGNHTWTPRDDMPAGLREALLDGGGVDATEELTQELRADLVQAEEELRAGRTHALKDVVAELDATPAEAQREEQRQDRDIQRRAEIAAAVTAEDVRDMEAIRASHPDILGTNGPRPVSVSGAPGSRQADVISRMHALAFEGYPDTIQDEVIWTEIATHALVSMREEQARTKRHADPALVTAVLDAVDHIARARGLVRRTGAGS